MMYPCLRVLFADGRVCDFRNISLWHYTTAYKAWRTFTSPVNHAEDRVNIRLLIWAQLQETRDDLVLVHVLA